MDAEITHVEVERFVSPQRPSGCSTKMTAATTGSFISRRGSMGAAEPEIACSERSTLKGSRDQGRAATRRPTRRYRADTMFYEVLILSDGGERFTIERDAPLAAGESFSNESEFYRVLAIEPGHGPFAGVSQAERLVAGD